MKARVFYSLADAITVGIDDYPPVRMEKLGKAVGFSVTDSKAEPLGWEFCIESKSGVPLPRYICFLESL